MHAFLHVCFCARVYEFVCLRLCLIWRDEQLFTDVVYFQDHSIMALMFLARCRFRLCKAKLRCLFLLLFGVACLWYVWMTSSYEGREESFLEYVKTWTHLVGLSGCELMTFAVEVVVAVMELE